MMAMVSLALRMPQPVVIKLVDGSDSSITWVSSDPAKASVDQNGVVYGKAAGTVTITATQGDLSYECSVTVSGSNFEGYYSSKSQYYIDGIYYTVSGSNATVTCKGEKDQASNFSYSDSVEIPSSISFDGKNYNVTSIGQYAFYCCKITGVSIPNSVTTIEKSAFSNCRELTSITIPNSVTSIGERVFQNCTALTSVIIPKNSVLTAIPNYAFYGCTAIQKMQLPVSVKKIGSYAYQNCSNMTETKIPSSITSIGASAFAGCTKLNDIYTYTIEPQPINQNTFATYTTGTVHVPAVSWYNYYYDTQWSQFLKLENFDEPYDYINIQKDFTLYTESVGTIKGDAIEAEIGATGGFIVDGNNTQALGERRSGIRIRCSSRWRIHIRCITHGHTCICR